jgi:threonyl-tRNA synthetase
MIELTFPDNSVRAYEAGTSGLDVATGISKSLAKKAVAMTLDGELKDLTDPIDADANMRS